ncbi:MAG: hypothetical protein K1X39_11625 [Thermoflexales bacterium]|nr:hypothetical protein [Thermoflexales bacterium]
MAGFRAGLITLFVGLLVGCAPTTRVVLPVPETQGETEAEYRITTLARLEAISLEARPVFVQALDDDDNLRIDAARAGYERTLTLVPDFPDALRRLAVIEADRRLFTAAEAHARKAESIEATGRTRGALAYVLLTKGNPADRAEGSQLAQNAAREAAYDKVTQTALMRAALANDDLATLDHAVDALLRIDPNDPHAHFAAGVAAVSRQDWEAAEAEFIEARTLGLSKSVVEDALNDGVSVKAAASRALKLALVVGGVLVPIGAVVVIGRLLNKVMLRLLRPYLIDTAEAPARPANVIRPIYHGAILLAALMAGLLLAAVVLPLAYLVLQVLWQSLFNCGFPLLFLAAGLVWYFMIYRRDRHNARVSQSALEVVVKPEDAPTVWAFSRTAATQAGTQPAATILIDTEAGITLTGMKLRSGGPCLRIGTGALNRMSQSALAAEIFRLYTVRAGAGSRLSRIVVRIQAFLAEHRQRQISNGLHYAFSPVWHVTNQCSSLFNKLSVAALLELNARADVLTARAHGAQNAIAALTALVASDAGHVATLAHHLRAALSQEMPPPDSFGDAPLPVGEQAEIDKAIAAEYARTTTRDDAILAPRERIRFLQRQPEGDGASRGPAWALFADAAAIKQAFTNGLVSSYHRYPRPT